MTRSGRKVQGEVKSLKKPKIYDIERYKSARRGKKPQKKQDIWQEAVENVGKVFSLKSENSNNLPEKV